MTETKHSTFRLGAAELRLLTQEAKRLSLETGLKVNRSDVLRKLIREHLGGKKVVHK